MQIYSNTKLLTIIVFFIFIVYTLYELYLILINKSDNQLKNEAKQTLLYIVSIATIAYSFIAYKFGTGKGENFETRSVRYLDWIITTPLITYSYYLVGRLNNVQVNFVNLLVTNLLFIGLGVVSEYLYQNKIKYKNLEIYFAILSFIFFGIFIYNIYVLTSKLKEKQVNTMGLEYFFYIGWTLYGVVFLGELLGYFKRDFVINSYAILDVINKVVYSYIANIVIDNSSFTI
jgi:bacteriorhodopsin